MDGWDATGTHLSKVPYWNGKGYFDDDGSSCVDYRSADLVSP